ASICFSGAKDVCVPGLAPGGRVLVVCAVADPITARGAAAAASAAALTTSRRRQSPSFRVSGVSMLNLVGYGCCKSAEREAKSLHARLEKLDFKLAIDNRSALPDQLVQTLRGHGTDALLIDVKSVSGARRLSIDQHAKLDGRSRCRGPHDQMKIAGVEAIHEAPVRLGQFGGLALYPPVAGH